MMAAMFSRKFETKPSEDGAFFIDRDGTHWHQLSEHLEMASQLKLFTSNVIAKDPRLQL